MSRAATAAANAPPPSEQPSPDLALSTPSTSDSIDNTHKSNIVFPDSSEPYLHLSDGEDLDEHSRPTPGWRRLKEAEAEGIYLWEVTKHYLFRPGVSGGLLGILNVSLLVGAGCAFYKHPDLRRDRKIVSSGIAAGVALASVEGLLADRFHRHCQELQVAESAQKCQVSWQSTLQSSNFLNFVNAVVLGTVGYFSYNHWNKPTWDHRIVSTVTVGLGVMWVIERWLVQTRPRS